MSAPELMGAAARAASTATPTPLGSSAPAAGRTSLGSSRYGYTFRRVLLGSDIIALLAAAAIANVAGIVAGRDALDAGQAALLIAFVPIWIALAGGVGLYHLADRRVEHSFAEELAPVFMVTTTWAWLLVLTEALVSDGPTELLWLGMIWGVAILSVLIVRSLTRATARNRDWYRQPVVLIGDGEGIDRVLRRILRHPDWGLDAIATIRDVDGQPMLDHRGDRGVRYTEPIECRSGNGSRSSKDIAEAVRSLDSTRAIVDGASKSLSERSDLIRVLAEHEIRVDYVSGEPETLFSSAVLHHLEGLPILSVQPTRLGRVAGWVKRTMDVVGSALGLLILSPFFLYAAIRIKLESAGPVCFRQRRTGRDGEVFEMLKLRTMVDGADSMRDDVRDQGMHPGGLSLLKLRNDPRITKTGRWLRRYSVDELPQLWNVVRGEMSLVGPRPLPLDEAPLVTDHFRERMRMRPGITGPWQIQGRSDIPFEDMVKLDYTYVVGWSMREDLSILLRTVAAVWRGRGAY